MLGTIVMVWLVANSMGDPDARPTTLPYSSVKDMIREGSVSSAEFEEHAIVVTIERSEQSGTSRFRAVIPTPGDPELLPLLEEQGVEVSAEEPAGSPILLYFLPWVLILAFYLWLQRRMMSGMAGGPGGWIVDRLLVRRGMSGFLDLQFAALHATVGDQH